MSNRKATFAKRQRESELKDHARQKEARRVERKQNPRQSKGPEIAWDQAVDTSGIKIDDVVPAGPQPGNTTAGDPTVAPDGPSAPAPAPSNDDD